MPSITFSILERIELGETRQTKRLLAETEETFSILERIELGETPAQRLSVGLQVPFSILERIELGETSASARFARRRRCFQYPRTDRIG